MKQTLILSFLIIYLNALLYGQAPSIDWQKCFGGFETNFGDIASCVQQTTDGGYIVAGNANSNDGDVTGLHGRMDCWIVKLNITGNIIWSKCLGGSLDEYPNSIKQTSDGGYIIAGWTTSSDGDATGLHGASDYWIVKISSTGNIEWQKCYGGSDFDEATSIDQTSDGGYIVAGYTNSNDGDIPGIRPGNTDYWIIKITSTGALQWQKPFGGISDDRATGIQQTTDGGYIISGRSESNSGDVTGNHGGTDYWILKLNGNGDIQWQKSLGGSAMDIATAVHQTSDGGYLVAGYTNSGNGDMTGYHSSNNGSATDYWVVKLNSTGNILWQRCLGGSDVEKANALALTPDGGCVVAGSATSNDGDVTLLHNPRDIWIVKLTNSGNIEWQQTYGGSNQEEPYSIQTTADGGYILAGFTNSGDQDIVFNPHFSSNDYWVVKLSAGTCTPSIDITPSSNNICSGTNVTLTATAVYGGLNPVYQWKKNGMNVGTNSNTYTSASFNNNDSIFCILTSNAVCATSNPLAVSDTVVMAVSNTIQPSVVVNASITTICLGESVSFSATTANAGNNPSYQWKLNNNNTGSNSPLYNSNSLANGDNVHCLLLTGNIGCSNNFVSSDTITMTVNNPPQITISPEDTLITTVTQLQLIATLTGSVSSFVWTPASSLTNPLSLSPHTILLTSNTTFTLQAMTVHGCSADKKINIRIVKPLFMPGAFTPNADGLNDIFRIPMDVSLILKDFSVYDRWGNHIFKTKDINKGWDGLINGRQANSGVYVFTISGSDEKGSVFLKGTFVLIR